MVAYLDQKNKTKQNKTKQTEQNEKENKNTFLHKFTTILLSFEFVWFETTATICWGKKNIMCNAHY